jgi:hypothetical protein
MSGVYASPPKLLFEPQDYFPLIGAVDLGATKHCTAFPLAPNLIVTNQHCVATKQECRNSKFQFWNTEEKDWLGQSIRRSFHCADLLYAKDTEDVALILTKKDPTQKYGAVRVLRSPAALAEDTPVLIMSQNPLNRKRINTCRTGLAGKKTKKIGSSIEIESVELDCNQAVIGGDSGSPVFNYHGDLVGLLWGRDLAVSTGGIMVPIHALLESLEREVGDFGIEWVDREEASPSVESF